MRQIAASGIAMRLTSVTWILNFLDSANRSQGLELLNAMYTQRLGFIAFTAEWLALHW